MRLLVACRFNDLLAMIDLSIELGEEEQRVVLIQTFMIIDEFSAYNAFLDQPNFADFRIALAPWHLTMKFLTKNGVRVVRGY